MPNKLRVLSAKEVIKFLERNGFVVYGTRGSHTKMKRILNERTQTLTIPLHNEIAKGTLRDIYNQIIEYIPESKDVTSFFFTE